MGMSTGGGADEAMMDINMTPLIDILLVLLIMFIITIPVMTHAVKLDMPKGQPPQAEPVQPTIINLEILFDGTITWNGTEIPSVDALEGYFRREAAMDPQPELHIRPNKLVEYKSVATVLASAQRLGVTKLGMIGNEKFVK